MFTLLQPTCFAMSSYDTPKAASVIEQPLRKPGSAEGAGGETAIQLISDV